MALGEGKGEKISQGHEHKTIWGLSGLEKVPIAAWRGKQRKNEEQNSAQQQGGGGKKAIKTLESVAQAGEDHACKGRNTKAWRGAYGVQQKGGVIEPAGDRQHLKKGQSWARGEGNKYQARLWHKKTRKLYFEPRGNGKN